MSNLLVPFSPSVGVIMYQLLGNGTVPFKGPESEYLMSISRGPEFSGALWDGISAAARQLVTALLSHTAGERPGSGAVVRSAWAVSDGGGAPLVTPPSAAALVVQYARGFARPSSNSMVRWKIGNQD
jgi:hypothetical protein